MYLSLISKPQPSFIQKGGGESNPLSSKRGGESSPLSLKKKNFSQQPLQWSFVFLLLLLFNCFSFHCLDFRLKSTESEGFSLAVGVQPPFVDSLTFESPCGGCKLRRPYKKNLSLLLLPSVFQQPKNFLFSPSSHGDLCVFNLTSSSGFLSCSFVFFTKMSLFV